MQDVAADLAGRVTDISSRLFAEPRAALQLLDLLRSEFPHGMQLREGRMDWRELYEWLLERPDERVEATLRRALQLRPDDEELVDLFRLLPPPDVLQTAFGREPTPSAAEGPSLTEAVGAGAPPSDAARKAMKGGADAAAAGAGGTRADEVIVLHTVASLLNGEAVAPVSGAAIPPLAPPLMLALRTAAAARDVSFFDTPLLLGALLEATGKEHAAQLTGVRGVVFAEPPARARSEQAAIGERLHVPQLFVASAPPDGPVRELAVVPDALIAFGAAARLAERVAAARDEPVVLWPRHVIAALLAVAPAGVPNEARNELTKLGIDLDRARRALLADVRSAETGEDEQVWEDVLRRTDPPSEAGYRPDYVDADAPDLLDIEQEVRAICGVIAANQVSPPLSLGLFGDWGTGKSFFMAKMQKHIEEMTKLALERERAQQPTGYCSRVLQIEFNAWHYADSNLWACLVTEIFEALHHEFGGDAESPAAVEKKLVDELRNARGVVEVAERQVKEAAGAVNEARTTLQDAVEERRRAESTVRALLADVPSLLRNDPATLKSLRDAANRLGYPEAAHTYEALEHTALELRSFGTRLHAVGRMILDSPFSWRMLPLLIGMLLVAPAIGVYLMSQGWVDAFGVRVVEVAAVISGVGAWIGEQLRYASRLTGRVEDALVSSRERRAEREGEETAKQRKALELAVEAEEAARERLTQARAEQQRLEAELREFLPGRQLQRLIEERAKSGEYTRHLGIVSLIRKDFERMSELLPRLAERNGAEERPPVQRIILYVDDLDRCRPERVVEVLEAVHLLMAFPLFIVVVGVDPRWLRRCLETHHAHLLADDGSPDAAKGTGRASTPQDYLEKIFQIPFALRPIEEDGYRSMVRDLITPRAMPEKARIIVDAVNGRPAQPADTDAERAAAANVVRPTPTVTRDVAAIAAAGDASARRSAGDTTGRRSAGDVSGPRFAGDAQDAERASGNGDSAATSHNLQLGLAAAEQLAFTSDEAADMQRLATFFRTPRAVKRFVNVYRLVRASVRPHELAAFQGQEARPGEYRAALVFLAVLTGFPNSATRLLTEFHTWLEELNGDSPPHAWDTFVARLQPENGAAVVNPFAANARDADWTRLATVLNGTTGTGFVRCDAATLARWARRTARYSFSVNLRTIV